MLASVVLPGKVHGQTAKKSAIAHTHKMMVSMLANLTPVLWGKLICNDTPQFGYFHHEMTPTTDRLLLVLSGSCQYRKITKPKYVKVEKMLWYVEIE